MRAQAADRSPAFAASLALHAAVLVGAMIAWSWNKPVRIGSVVPVTLMTSPEAANLPPALASPTPAPAAAETPAPEAPPAPPAPVEAPVPTPPPTTRTPPQPKPEPHPLAQAKPAPKPTPTPKPAPAKPPPPPKAAAPSFDPDAVLASLDKASKATGARRSSAPRGPNRAETAVVARVAPGSGSAISSSVLSDLQGDLQRLWNPNCDVPGGADVVIKASFQLGFGGRLVGAPEASGETSSDPVVRAASDRAKRAIYQEDAQGRFSSTLSGQKITVNFNAKQFCDNR